MANVKLVFSGGTEYECYERTLVAYVNAKGGLYVSITNTEDDDEISNQQHTVLDRDTAIKLSKELRKQIALMD